VKSPSALMARVRVPVWRCQAEAMVKGWAPLAGVPKSARRNWPARWPGQSSCGRQTTSRMPSPCRCRASICAGYRRRAADVSAQREQGGDDASGGEQGGQPAERLLPEAAGQHHQAVEDAGQEDGTEGFMHEAKPAVGNAFDKGDDDQRQQDVAGPFADVLGEFHPEFRRALGAAAWTGGDQPGACQIFGQPFAHPVGKNEDATADAEVLVQPVELVQPAEALFQPTRAARTMPALIHHRARTPERMTMARRQFQKSGLLASRSGRTNRPHKPSGRRTREVSVRFRGNVCCCS